MAAPCRSLSYQLYGIFRGHSRYSSVLGISTRCRKTRAVTFASQRQLIKWRTVSTACPRFSTGSSPGSLPGSSQGQPAEQKPKVGLLKRLALRTHHSTIWVLDRVSPKARVFYERFVDGVTSFLQDFRHVYSLNKRIKNKEVKLEELDWKDLYKKIKMKEDVAKVLPVLVVVNIPFVYYVTLPVVLYFQRIFLSDHFITPEDVSSNHQENHKKRLLLYPHIMKILDKRLVKKPTAELAEALRHRISGSEIQKEPLTAAELLSYRSVYGQQAALKALSRTHLKYLCKLHSQWVFLASSSTLRKRLATHASLMVAMDTAVLKAGIESIEDQDLRKLCYQRGLNPVGSDRKTLEAWLLEWTQVTTALSDPEWSLLLHASILLVSGRPHQGEQTVKQDQETSSRTDAHQG